MAHNRGVLREKRPTTAVEVDGGLEGNALIGGSGVGGSHGWFVWWRCRVGVEPPRGGFVSRLNWGVTRRGAAPHTTMSDDAILPFPNLSLPQHVFILLSPSLKHLHDNARNSLLDGIKADSRSSHSLTRICSTRTSVCDQKWPRTIDLLRPRMPSFPTLHSSVRWRRRTRKNSKSWTNGSPRLRRRKESLKYPMRSRHAQTT